MKFQRLREGLTRNSFIAVIYSIFVFTPTVQYLNLMAGPYVSITFAWFTLILFLEFGRLAGLKFTKQEALFIYIMAGPWGSSLNYIYNVWFSQSEIAKTFGLYGKIPYWYAPTPETRVFELRTFLHSAWITPILIDLINMVVVWVILGVPLGLLTREIYVEVEDLPFPIQQMEAKGIITLIESEDEQATNILFIFALFGFIWGFIVYAFPYLFQAWTGRIATIVPVPWFDMNIMAERAGFGGAMFGVATDITYIASAFVLPTRTLISMIIGSFSINFVGNWLSVKYNLSPLPWWEPKMGIPMMWQRSVMFFWGSIIIGLSLATGIVPLLRYPRLIKKAFSTMLKAAKASYGERKTEPFSFYKAIFIPLVIGLFIGATLYYILVPTFFLKYFYVIIPMLVLIPIIYVLIQGRMIGETGMSVAGDQSFIRVFYLSTGYPDVDIWFVPTPTVGAFSSGASWLQWFKTADLCDMSMRGFIKLFIALLPFGWLLSLFFAQSFWSMAPIPEGYPGVSIFWPITATYGCLWIKGIQYQLFKPEWVVGAFLAGAGLYAICEFLPLSMVGLISGASSPTPFASTWLIGLIIVTILKKTLGKGWWEKNKQIAAVGLLIGESIATALTIAVVLILKALWLRPY
jgi:hypothetical protein